MFYCLYKITNWYNGKIYIGVHKTTNLNDSYMGSGVVIKRAIAKYGIEYFTKEILEEFNSIEEMFAAEKYIVNEEFINDSYTYNLKTGGYLGTMYSKETCEKISNILKGRKLTDEQIEKMRGIIVSEETKQKMSNSRKGEVNAFYGKTHSEETRKKISEAAKIAAQKRRELKNSLKN